MRHVKKNVSTILHFLCCLWWHFNTLSNVSMFTCYICVNSFSSILCLSFCRERRLLNFTSTNWKRRALPMCPAGYLLPPPQLLNWLSAHPGLSQHAAAELTATPLTSLQGLQMVRWIIVARYHVLINIIKVDEKWNIFSTRFPYTFLIMFDGCIVYRQVGCGLHFTLSGKADTFPGELPYSPTTVAAGNTQRQGEYREWGWLLGEPTCFEENMIILSIVKGNHMEKMFKLFLKKYLHIYLHHHTRHFKELVWKKVYIWLGGNK